MRTAHDPAGIAVSSRAARWCDRLGDRPVGRIDRRARGSRVARRRRPRAASPALGDDLFVTDRERLARGVRDRVANAVLVKPNQTGTLTSALEVVQAAQQASYATILSARSGESEDSWLADLAVGWRTGQIKAGSTTRSERTAMWNRLLRIEAELGDDGQFAGAAALSRFD